MRAFAHLFCFLAALSLLPGLLWPQAPAPPAAVQPHGSITSAEALLELTRSEIELYQKAPTVVDSTPQQIKNSPILHELQLAADQGQLAEILKRARETGELTFQDLPRIACTEAVTSQMGSGKNALVAHQRFRY